MKKLFEYSNFWLIWLECAGDPEGTSLFKIQEEWKITTNYLYHKEKGLGKSLLKNMIEQGYMQNGKKGPTAKFDWIPSYVLEKHKLTDQSGWSLNSFIIEKMPAMQKFIEHNHTILFDRVLLKKLYRNDLSTIKSSGSTIFDDIRLFVFVSNMMPFCKKYGADIVTRMLFTMLSFYSEKDLLSYFNTLRQKISEENIPTVIENEGELVRVLYTMESQKKQA
ncbi:MAG: hypothetical protein ABIF85_03250 [Nanoarchaeota archaeon]|nr:hypothetical protein [Nanoarchaeota archaeon]MBU4301037.1 hypothetical protein [Nanoarchaeota archaeon]MBU4451721.1 hypothetical protein [Nanoarchaeota archaeon]MCG2723959.1 hypothetical protein [archaeon]